MFITFEGGEGSGKSNLSNIVYNKLSEKYDVIKVNDPSSSTEEFQLIRKILLSKQYNISKNTELLLYLASRAQLVDTYIKPALEQNRIVLCDRFIDSTTVYQGYMKGHSLDTIKQFNALICKGVYPDLTVLCDVDAKIGLARSNGRLEANNIDEGKWEALGLAFHEKVNKWYRHIATLEDRFFVVDSNTLTIDQMAKIVLELIKWQKLY